MFSLQEEEKVKDFINDCCVRETAEGPISMPQFSQVSPVTSSTDQGCIRGGGVTGLKGGDFLGKIPIFGRKK